MLVDEALIDQLANLNKLQFSPDEKKAMIADMKKMIGFVEKLNELDTTGVEPLRHMGNQVNVVRADVVQPNIDRATALKNAAHHDAEFFKVPKVISRDA